MHKVTLMLVTCASHIAMQTRTRHLLTIGMHMMLWCYNCTYNIQVSKLLHNAEMLLKVGNGTVEVSPYLIQQKVTGSSFHHLQLFHGYRLGENTEVAAS